MIGWCPTPFILTEQGRQTESVHHLTDNTHFMVLGHKLVQRWREQKMLILPVILEYLHTVASQSKSFLLEIIPHFVALIAYGGTF
jgi:hypothetical protein